MPRKTQKYVRIDTAEPKYHDDEALHPSSVRHGLPSSTKPPQRWRQTLLTVANLALITLNLVFFTIYSQVLEARYLPGPQHASCTCSFSNRKRRRKQNLVLRRTKIDVCVAPMRIAIAYDDRVFDVQAIYREDGSLNHLKSNNDLNGPPRSELEEAWEKINKRNQTLSPLTS
jgi:hypothetical protein